MPFALLLALAAISGATVLTYAYDRDAGIWSRLCAGVCLGFAALGLVGFAFASVLGMGPPSLMLAGLVCCAPLLLLLARADWRARLSADLREGAGLVGRALAGKGGAGAVVFY